MSTVLGAIVSDERASSVRYYCQNTAFLVKVFATEYRMNPFDKWAFRSNRRRTMEFGVNEPSDFSKNGGESWRRFNSVETAKAAAEDNIECLRLMRTDKFRAHLKKLNIEAKEFYLKLRSTE